MTIHEENAGLHFLVKVDTDLSDEALVARCAAAGIRIRALSHYYHGSIYQDRRHTLVVNYAGLREEQIDALEEKLKTL